jgi:hypothetical protein
MVARTIKRASGTVDESYGYEEPNPRSVSMAETIATNRIRETPTTAAAVFTPLKRFAKISGEVSVAPSGIVAAPVMRHAGSNFVAGIIRLIRENVTVSGVASLTRPSTWVAIQVPSAVLPLGASAMTGNGPTEVTYANCSVVSDDV